MTASTTMPKPRAYLLNGPTYTPGKVAAGGAKQSFKLPSNESAVGVSPSVIAAIAAGANEQHLYPDPDGANLVQAIAQRNGLDVRRVVTGPGSEAIIIWLIQGWAEQGDEIVYSAHGFQAYRIRAMSHGIVPVAAPETGMQSDVHALLAAVTPEDADHVRRQSQPPDRHLDRYDRVDRTAPRAAPGRFAGGRRGLMRIRGYAGLRQRYRAGE